MRTYSVYMCIDNADTMQNRQTVKKCSTCHEVKSVPEFYRRARGLSSRCRECQKLWSKEQARRGYFRTRRADQRVSRVRPLKKDVYSPIQRAAVELHTNARKRSFLFNRSFNLDRKWVIARVEEFCATNYYSLEPWHPFKPSLDRIDNSKDYEADNVKVVWLIENYARNRFTEQQLVEFCMRKLGIYDLGKWHF